MFKVSKAAFMVVYLSSHAEPTFAISLFLVGKVECSLMYLISSSGAVGNLYLM
jgi:hypothetical protein